MWKIIKDSHEILQILNSVWYGFDKKTKDFIKVEIIKPPFNHDHINNDFEIRLNRSDIKKSIDGVLTIYNSNKFRSKINNKNFDLSNEEPEFDFELFKFKNKNDIDLLGSSSHTYIKFKFKNRYQEKIPNNIFKVVFNHPIKYNDTFKFNDIEKNFKSVCLEDFKKNGNGKLPTIEFFGLDSKHGPYALHILDNSEYHAHYGNESGVIVFKTNTREYLNIDTIGDNVHKITLKNKLPQYYKFFVLDEDYNNISLIKFNIYTLEVSLLKYYKNQ